MANTNNPLSTVWEQDGSIIKIDVQNKENGAAEIKINIQSKETEYPKIEIDIQNIDNGMDYKKAPVYVTNTLGQILEEYALDICFCSGSNKAAFRNRRNKKMTCDLNKIVAEFGLKDGDVLEVMYASID